eukprot:gene11163-8305_t
MEAAAAAAAKPRPVPAASGPVTTLKVENSVFGDRKRKTTVTKVVKRRRVEAADAPAAAPAAGAGLK